MKRSAYTAYDPVSGTYDDQPEDPVNQPTRLPQDSLSKLVTWNAAVREELKSYKSYDAVSSPTVMSTDPTTAPASTPFTIISTATGACINQIPRGTTNSQRVGRACRIRYVRVSGLISPGAAGTSWSNVTFYVIHDKSPNQAAALPAHTAIFVNQGPNALPTINGESDYVILHQHTIIQLGTLAAAPHSDQGSISFDLLIACDINTKWTTSDSTGIFTNMVSGSIYLYAGGVIFGTFGTPTAKMMTRVYFEDD